MMPSIKELSENTKAFLYLLSVMVAVAGGSIATYKSYEKFAATPEKISIIQTSLDALIEENIALKARINIIEQAQKSKFVPIDDLSKVVSDLGFVKFDSPLSVRSQGQLSFALSRHDNYFINSYEFDPSRVGVLQIWTLQKE